LNKFFLFLISFEINHITVQILGKAVLIFELDKYNPWKQRMK